MIIKKLAIQDSVNLLGINIHIHIRLVDPHRVDPHRVARRRVARRRVEAAPRLAAHRILKVVAPTTIMVIPPPVPPTVQVQMTLPTVMMTPPPPLPTAESLRIVLTQLVDSQQEALMLKNFHGGW
jgi:hypothetical protein